MFNGFAGRSNRIAEPFSNGSFASTGNPQIWKLISRRENSSVYAKPACLRSRRKLPIKSKAPQVLLQRAVGSPPRRSPEQWLPMRIERIVTSDDALLHMERYCGEGTRSYSNVSDVNEANPDHQPESES